MTVYRGSTAECCCCCCCVGRACIYPQQLAKRLSLTSSLPHPPTTHCSPAHPQQLVPHWLLDRHQRHQRQHWRRSHLLYWGRPLERRVPVELLVRLLPHPASFAAHLGPMAQSCLPSGPSLATPTLSAYWMTFSTWPNLPACQRVRPAVVSMHPASQPARPHASITTPYTWAPPSARNLVGAALLLFWGTSGHAASLKSPCKLHQSRPARPVAGRSRLCTAHSAART